MSAAPRRLRIAQVAPPLERVPPVAYGGTERIVHGLTTELVARGHEVTTFASGDSDVPGTLVPTVERALRPAGIEGDSSGWFLATVQAVLDRAADFDVIHSHLEWWSIPMARMSSVPMASTFHGRLDLPWSERLFENAPDGLVAISRSQASAHPGVPWTIIHNGLSLEDAPFETERDDAFCFVGRVDPEKGIVEAMEIAAITGRPLRIAAKVGNLPGQRDYYENVFLPALKSAGSSVEYLGELAPHDRDALFAKSYGTLMPGGWPEPFGLVSIESLACGTPILARRVGALPEVIREGVDGFFGDDATGMAFHADRLAELDRRAIRERVIERFSTARMTDRYEELYQRLIGSPLRAASPKVSFRIPPAGATDRPEAERSIVTVTPAPAQVDGPDGPDTPGSEPVADGGTASARPAAETHA
jgi:glycosyltransferase involved in cell wall biosynthesis